MTVDAFRHDTSPEAMVEAIVDNHRQTFLALAGFAPGGEAVRCGESDACFTYLPIPLFNCVVRPRFSSESADAGIEAILAHAREHGVPMLWQVTPGSEPADLRTRLTTHGFVCHETVPGMAIDLDLLPDVALPPDARVERVRDHDTLEAYVATAMAVFEIPAEMSQAVVRLFEGVAFDDPSVINYVARVDGQVVAISAANCRGGCVGIFNVATLPEFRGRGLGGALTAAPLREARERGYRIGVLTSSPMAFSTYRRLGFSQYCEFEYWAWPGGEAE
jgi:GNAT superfamily N-acetyltransferase